MHRPIWIAPLTSNPRLERVQFSFCIEGAVQQAELHLLARMRYVLRVGSQEIGSGPIRSYPEFHEYDTYDLAPYLQDAQDSTLTVEVLHWNMATFHNLQEAPGFEAWGTLRMADGSEASFDTPSPHWKASRIVSLDPTAPRLSFAQPPVEIADFVPEECILRTMDAAPDPTQNPLPRSIPFLTKHVRHPAVAQLSSVEETDDIVFGTRFTDDGNGSDPFSPAQRFAALGAWIYSSVEQTVLADGWWGEYVLNGQTIHPKSHPTKPLCQTIPLALTAGWNLLYVSQRLAFGYAEFCIGLPRAAKLLLRTAPDPASAEGFWCTRTTYSEEAFRELSAALQSSPHFPKSHWENHSLPTQHPSPLRHVAWTHSKALLATLDGSPATLPAGSTILLTLDMGEMILGRFSLNIQAPDGTLVDFTHAEECRTESTGIQRARTEKAVVVYGADRWILSSKRTAYTLINPRGFRYMDVLIRVPSGPQSAILHSIGVQEERYPYTYVQKSQSPDFGDDDFNRLWAYGRRTLELCSNDVFVDCPWRERTLYGGDLLPEMAASVVFSPHDLRLARHSIDVVLQSLGPSGWLTSNAPMPRLMDEHALGEYALITSIATGWYLRLTHDTPFATRAWPVFQTMAATASGWLRPDGIYHLPGRAFIDHGRRICEGATCEFNAALVAAFRAWAYTAEMSEHPNQAASLRAQADALDAALPAAFFDPIAKTFRDLPIADGGTETEGTPANIWALLFTRSARAYAPEAIEAIRASLTLFSRATEPNSASPYQMFYLLAALHKVGANDLAEQAIHLVYRDMLDHPTGTLWEHSDTDNSLVHAWSCGALSYLAAAQLSRPECLFNGEF